MELNGWLANTADGVCAVGTDGKIVLWNRAAERILGHAAREVLDVHSRLEAAAYANRLGLP